MSIIITLLTIVMVAICILIVFLVLMQRPKQEGLGAAFGGGMTDQMFGSQTTNVLQKGTTYLAIAFFVIALLLSVLMGKQNRENTTIDSNLSNAPEVEAAPAIPAPGDLEIPASLSDGEIDTEAAAALGMKAIEEKAEEAATAPAEEKAEESVTPGAAPKEEATPAPAPAAKAETPKAADKPKEAAKPKADKAPAPAAKEVKEAATDTVQKEAKKQAKAAGDKAEKAANKAKKAAKEAADKPAEAAKEAATSN